MTETSPFFQNPHDSDALYLLEAILSASQGADRGFAVFAFVSIGGVELLFDDSIFREFIGKGSFQLIVGIDAVTNTAALESLSNAADNYPNLEVKAFFHNDGGLFHPKFCWFGSPTGGTSIVGSGNLTKGGLRDNWEAFEARPVTMEELATIEQDTNSWMQANATYLRDLDDPEVVERVSKNKGWSGQGGGGTGTAEEVPESDVDEPGEDDVDGTDKVLVAEIPKGGPRWNQANFDKATFEEYFEASPESQKIVFLKHVDESGAIVSSESRPSVSVKSHNYRFELGAASGMKYPNAGRPIGVFVRDEIRTFRYRVSMPGDPGHKSLVALLNAEWSGLVGRMRRVRTDLTTLKSYWPSQPF
ncbi:MAG: hypothetical protein HQ478_11520 [Chloroflexi bacterium]|nr:hypothetical protein [Chloroflexota bacterium]